MERNPYTIEEIGEMRIWVRCLIEGPTLHWTFNKDGSSLGMGRSSYNANERNLLVEDQLRTYMLNGTTVSELREAVNKQNAVEHEARERAKARYEQKAPQQLS